MSADQAAGAAMRRTNVAAIEAFIFQTENYQMAGGLKSSLDWKDSFVVRILRLESGGGR
jgi:hypothetical protein